MGDSNRDKASSETNKAAEVKQMALFISIHLQQLAELILGIPLALFFWPVLLYFWFLLKCLRFGVEFLLNAGTKILGGKSAEVSYTLASGSDSVFGYKSENNCNSVIPGYCVVRGGFDYDLICDRTLRMVGGNPKLKEKFVQKCGFYCWEKNEGDFDIKNHVRVIAEAKDVFDEDRLLKVMEVLAVVPVSSGQPSWELLLIPSFRCNGEDEEIPVRHFAEIVRVHHAYGDGVSFCLTSNAYLFDTPAKLPLDPKKSFPVPTWAIALQYVKVVLLGPLYFLWHVVHFINDDSKFGVPVYSPTKFMARSEIPVKLSTLKTLKTQSDASVTAILISSISASLRSVHERLFPLEDVPLNLNTANVNAMLPYPNDQICNRFTIFPFPAPFSETQAERRLERTNEAGYRVTLSPDPIFCYFIMKVVGDLPAFLQTQLLNISGTPIMLSNIPGIMDRVHIYDGVVVDSGAWLPLIRFTGVAVATYTYCGELRFCGMADPKIFPQKSDLQDFLDGIVDEVHQLARLFNDAAVHQDQPHNHHLKQSHIHTDENTNEIHLTQRYVTSKKA